MTRSRLLTVFIVAVSTVLLAGLLLPPTSLRSIVILSLTLLAGLVLGLVLSGQSRMASARGAGASPDLETDSDFSPRMLGATINEMREGLLVIDEDMRVVVSNKAARSLFSNIEDPLNSRRLTELTRNPAIYDAFLDAVRGKERAGVKVETYSQGKQVFDLRVVPLQTANGRAMRGAVGVFFDITRLERLELIRQEFLSNVSHELRTPLTSIIALVETLEAGAIDDDDHNRRFLSIIQKNASRMHRLIDDILELSAIEAGNVKVNLEATQLRPLVDEVIGS